MPDLRLYASQDRPSIWWQLLKSLLCVFYSLSISQVVTVPDLRLYVQVGSRDRPSIHLAATFEVSQPDFLIEKGVRIFPDLEIVAKGDEAQSVKLGRRELGMIGSGCQNKLRNKWINERRNE